MSQINQKMSQSDVDHHEIQSASEVKSESDDVVYWFNNEPGNISPKVIWRLCIDPNLIERSRKENYFNRTQSGSGTAREAPSRCKRYQCYICGKGELPLFECCECKKVVDLDHTCYNVWIRPPDDTSYTNNYKVCSICVMHVNREEFKRRLLMHTPYRAPTSCVQRLRGTNSFASRASPTTTGSTRARHPSTLSIASCDSHDTHIHTHT